VLVGVSKERRSSSNFRKDFKKSKNKNVSAKHTMNLISNPKQNTLIFNEDYETYENFEDNFEDRYELKHPSIITKYPTTYAPDHSITIQKKDTQNRTSARTSMGGKLTS
jgi:hypothetical protein